MPLKYFLASYFAYVSKLLTVSFGVKWITEIFYSIAHLKANCKLLNMFKYGPFHIKHTSTVSFLNFGSILEYKCALLKTTACDNVMFTNTWRDTWFKEVLCVCRWLHNWLLPLTWNRLRLLISATCVHMHFEWQSFQQI